MAAIRIVVTGRVQGVAFRASAQAQARGLGLCGWVRNLRDGRVEVVAQGEAAALDALEAWCRRGPRAARVLDVAAAPYPCDPALRDFAIERTGDG